MTMEIINIISNSIIVEKQIGQMAFGEVCYITRLNQYVLRATLPIEDKQTWIILSATKSELLRYSSEKTNTGWCYWNEKVRELYPDESITIKFS